jgi:hypothetical protein
MGGPTKCGGDGRWFRYALTVTRQSLMQFDLPVIDHSRRREGRTIEEFHGINLLPRSYILNWLAGEELPHSHYV